MLVFLNAFRTFSYGLILFSIISQFNVAMGSESENLDKCFEVVSDVVQKAGDVSEILSILTF